jgi:hypothetical protein
MFEGLYRHDGWDVGLIRAPVASLLAGGTPHIAWLGLGGRHGFAADPFLIAEAGTLYCFFESLPYATDRGKICYAVIEGSAAVHVADAIVEPYHLSYPYLLRYGGELVCIPEAGESGSVSAYVARSFPDGWERRHTLIAGFPGIDNTVFEHDGRWWLLATDGRAGTNSDLHVFYADDLFGRWQPHRANPVKRDARGTRPAGRPFRVDGRLYRPAQDCTSRYGGRLILNEIVELSTDRFSERLHAVLEPDPHGPFPAGLHTANAADGAIAVDGNRLHFVPRQAARAVTRKFRQTLARLAPAMR